MDPRSLFSESSANYTKLAHQYYRDKYAKKCEEKQMPKATSPFTNSKNTLFEKYASIMKPKKTDDEDEFQKYLNQAPFLTNNTPNFNLLE